MTAVEHQVPYRVLDVPVASGPGYRLLDLAVDALGAGAARPMLDGRHYVLLPDRYLLSQFLQHRYPQISAEPDEAVDRGPLDLERVPEDARKHLLVTVREPLSGGCPRQSQFFSSLKG